MTEDQICLYLTGVICAFALGGLVGWQLCIWHIQETKEGAEEGVRRGMK